MGGKYAKDQPQGFSNKIEKVAVVGAGGHIGKHIVEHLLKTGKHTITAITRPSSTINVPEDVQVTRVDYSSDDDAALVEALQGQQALIITMSVTAPPTTTSKLVRAAIKAGVSYVLPNWFGQDSANDGLCRDTWTLPTRDGIASSLGADGTPTSYLLLVCGFWYEYSLGGGPDRYGFDVAKRALLLLDGGDVAINTSTWPQCGRAVASLLSLKVLPDDEADEAVTLSRFRNAPVYISSFRVSQRDMFESVKRVTGTADGDWSITHESAEQRWKEGQAAVLKGDFAAFPKMLYSRVFFPNGDGDYQSSRGLHNDVLGLPVEELDAATAVGVRRGENGEL